MRDYDLVVIGSGPAGHHGAIQAAKLGKKVAVAEMKSCVGGACINTGTIPSKTLREAVLHLSGFKQRGLYNVAYESNYNISMNDLSRRVDEVIRTEIGVFNNQFRKNGIDILSGRASFIDANTLRVQGDVQADCRARFVLIATGTRPAHHPSIPLDNTHVFDTDALISLPVLQKLLTIVGGGVIGVEYACMAAALGISATL